MRRVLGTVGLLPVLVLLFASATLAARPATAFTGSWAGIDPGDGSNVTLTIVGAKTIQAVLTDDNATTACAGASTPVFTGFLVGKVNGSEMATRITAAMCGTVPLPFVTGAQIDWWLVDGGNADPADDVLYNSFGEEYFRTS